ncbi:MAG: carbohydrate kinase family protein [Chloroflexi bacterium]|nr:carbohydrate kinase family protein [Chloroflexota bacterium]
MTILVSGLINIETTIQVDGFPVAYTPVRYPFFGVNASVSGVGYNVAKALHTLGSPPRFLSLIGRDIGGRLVYEALGRDGLPATFIAAELEHTPRSAILYDHDGRRMINVDLKDVQERAYPPALFEAAAQGATLAVLCNINFSRPFLTVMRARGVPVATDVHAISDLDSDYDRDFMRAADILFMSDERLPCLPEDWIRRVWDRYGTPVAVIGLGAQGALLAVKDDAFIERIPAVVTRPVVSTIGAGDALFSCFVHVYHRTGDPYDAIRRAMVFASYKIGAAGAADGFLDAPGLDRLCAELGTPRPE